MFLIQMKVAKLQNMNATKIQAALRGFRDRRKVRVIRVKEDAKRKQRQWLESYRERNSPIPASYSDPHPDQFPSPEPIMPSSLILPKPTQQSIVDDEKLREINEKLKLLEDIEQRIKESENNVRLEAQKAEERMREQLHLLEEKTRKAEADRLARDELLKLAVGPVTDRSPFVTFPNKSSESVPPTSRGIKNAFSTINSAPPTGRSARMEPIPPNAPRLFYAGQEWVQLWDSEHQAPYWWCANTQKAQWEQPGIENTLSYQSHAEEKEDAISDSGYESTSGMTDYSSDHDISYFRSEESDLDGWQEYWDEQAQAKYWYNNNTVSSFKQISISFIMFWQGEASWTLPDELQSRASLKTTQGSIETSYGNGWTSYIDEQTGQMYWHNINTGEVRWDY